MIQILVLIILIFINAFFAATEMAFVSINDAKVEKEAKSGNKKAIQIYKMIREPSKFLATIQIGITLAGFLSSAFASESFADELAPILNNLMPLGINTWNTISIVLITIILSYFTLVFGEFKVELPAAKAKKVIDGGYNGKTVVMGIRPEDIYDDQLHITEAPDATTDVEIELTEMMGAETYLYFSVEGVNFTARVNPRTKAELGQKITIALDPNKIHLFDKETEAAILN